MFTGKTHKIAKSKKTPFKKVIEWMHLWMGLISGIIVFVVCLTGAIWVFRYEVWYFTEKYQRVEIKENQFLPPSELISKSENYLYTKEDSTVTLKSITYGKPGRSVACTFELSGKRFAQIHLNPYTGEMLKDKREPSTAEKFFIFIRAGHRFFWLPQNIGSPVVGSACIVFLLLLITGLIWWYPTKWTNKTTQKNFKIKWNARWKRLNIDLHNVVGFYSFLFIFILTVSGIVYTFGWFENGLYRTLTWKGKEEAVSEHPVSDTTITATKYSKPEDVIWHRIQSKYANTMGRAILEVPEEPDDPYEVAVFFGDGTINYNAAFYYYDQKTLKELQHTDDRTTPYQKLSLGEKVFRMNFDIHTGQILGLPSKILAFLASIIGASLPVTGSIIWYNRKWGKRKKGKE